MLYANVDEETGPKLQRLIRHGTNPVSSRRAEVILSSGLRTRIADLEHQYYLDESVIIRLIEDFNRRGMDAITDGTRQKRDHMVPEELSIVAEIIHMPPQLLGQLEDEWTLDALVDVLTERQYVKVVDPTEIARLLKEHRGL